MSEGSGELPAGWVKTTLSEVTSASRAKAEPANFGDVPYIGLEHIEGGSNRILSIGTVEDVKSTKSVFQRGDVLYGKLRPYLKKVCRPDFDGVCSTDILVFSESPSLDNRYLLYFLSQQSTADYATQNSNGINLPRISSRTLGEIEFPLPPLAEQRRIVAKIKALQERSRRAREALSEVGPLLEQFRQSVLAAAFRGDLTADWRAAHPDVEPASALLQRIRAERRRRWEEAELAKYEARGQKPPKNWQEKYQEPEPIDDSNLPELPEGWCWARLPELGYMNRGKSRHRPRNAVHLYGGSYPFVQTGDIAQSRGRVISHKQTYSEAGLAQSRLWPEGTVCITIAANIASSAVLGYPACFPDSVVGLIPDESLCASEFVEFFIRTSKGDLERFAPSTAQKNINLETLTEVAVPLPPFDESREITRLLTELIDSDFRIDEIVATLIEQLDQLDQAILAKAFRGELVPQDPDDEPASVLLERIRARRAQQAEATKGRKKTAKTQRTNALAKPASGVAPQHQAQPQAPTAAGQPMSPEQLQLEY